MIYEYRNLSWLETEVFRLKSMGEGQEFVKLIIVFKYLLCTLSLTSSEKNGLLFNDLC